MATHIEHPGSLHSNPALRNISALPSDSAAFFTKPDPGTTSPRTPFATFFPSATSAAAWMSDKRLLVHDPINTMSIGVFEIGLPGSRSIYFKAASHARLFTSESADLGSGIVSLIPTTCSGLVPQVTCGWIAEASIETSLSAAAPSSLGRVRQCLTA